MADAKRKNRSGFTLAEVLVATALAGVILSAAVLAFSQSLDVSQVVTNRGEMQQNARVAINLLARDLSVAGTGIPVGGITLPTPVVATAEPRIGCGIGQTSCWVLPPPASGLSYISYLNPLVTGPPNTYTMYAINPGDGLGPTIQTSAISSGNAPYSVATDIVTILFKDANYPTTWNSAASGSLDQFQVAGLSITGTAQVTFAAGTNPAIDDAVYGLNNGDVLLFQNVHGSALGVVTTVDGTNRIATMAAPSGDPLYFNQTDASAGSLANLQSYDTTVSPSVPTPSGCPAPMGCFPATTAYRVVVVTYYIDALTNPTTPRLMRQVNALPPTPVAENIENLQFSYDVPDSNTGVIYPNLGDPRTNSYSPNQIGKVNIFVAFRSQQQRLTLRGFSRLTMATAVTPRNLDFLDRYQ